MTNTIACTVDQTTFQIYIKDAFNNQNALRFGTTSSAISIRLSGQWEWLKITDWYLINVNTLRSRQNGRHFADDTFKLIFVNENVRILIKISLKFVPYGPINNIPELVQIMAWRRPGDKPLSEPMMVSLLTHICVTRPQWVNLRAFVICQFPHPGRYYFFV